MENRRITVGEGIGRAFAAFFRDLGQGDPVAIIIALAMVLFVLAILAFGAWVIWRRKAAAEQFRQKVEEKRKREDKQYKASKKVKEI